MKEYAKVPLPKEGSTFRSHNGYTIIVVFPSPSSSARNISIMTVRPVMATLRHEPVAKCSCLTDLRDRAFGSLIDFWTLLERTTRLGHPCGYLGKSHGATAAFCSAVQCLGPIATRKRERAVPIGTALSI